MRAPERSIVFAAKPIFRDHTIGASGPPVMFGWRKAHSARPAPPQSPPKLPTGAGPFAGPEQALGATQP